MKSDFYVYEWFNVDTNEIFYVGKGRNNRYKDITQRNNYFKNYYNKYNCDVRKVKTNLNESEAFNLEIELISKYRETNQAKCNLTNGGDGATFPQGSWNDIFSKLRTLYYAQQAMDDMENEEDYDPKNLKTKSLQEMKKLYDDYYEYKENHKLYKQIKNDCKLYNSLPLNEYELSAFEIETINDEIVMLTNFIVECIVNKNEEFVSLLNCKTEIDYMCIDIDINKLLDMLIEDNNYFYYLLKALRINLWLLKRIGNNPFVDQYIKIKSFSIKENEINIKFNTSDDKETKRVKINLYDITWGIIIFKDKPLYQIIYEEIIVAPFIN